MAIRIRMQVGENTGTKVFLKKIKQPVQVIIYCGPELIIKCGSGSGFGSGMNGDVRNVIPVLRVG